MFTTLTTASIINESWCTVCTVPRAPIRRGSSILEFVACIVRKCKNTLHTDNMHITVITYKYEGDSVLGLSRPAFICRAYWTGSSIIVKHQCSTVSFVRLFKKVQTGGGNPMHRSYSKKIQRQIFPPNRLQTGVRVFHEHELWQTDKKLCFIMKRLQTVRRFFNEQGLWEKQSKTDV